MGNPCNSKTVTGGLAAMLEASGIKLTGDALEAVGLEGEVQYHATSNKIGAELQSEAPNADDSKTIHQHTNKLNGNVVSKVIVDQRNPSGILGEEFVAPILKFSSDFHAANWHNLGAARSAYTKGMKTVLDGIDTSGLSATKLGYFKEWSTHLLNGGVFYPHDGKTGLTEAVGNWVSNTIKSSPHVIQGHFLASALKLTALYPDTAIQGTFKAVSQGLFKEVPELKAAGLYGVAHPEAQSENIFKRNWDGLIKLIDTPVSNVFYYAGEARGGQAEGLRAAQRGAFKMRLNDTPRQLWSQEGKSQNRLLNWTVNSMRLYSSLWYDVATKQGMDKAAAAGSLALFHALPFAVGGAYAASIGKDFKYGGWAATLPAPLVTALGWADPTDAKNIQANRTGFSELTSVRNVSGIGASLDAASRTFQNTPKAIGKASTYFHMGDTTNGILELGEAALSLGKFFNIKGPLGVINDGTTQKAYDIFKKQSEGTATEDMGTAFQHLFFPVTEPPK